MTSFEEVSFLDHTHFSVRRARTKMTANNAQHGQICSYANPPSTYITFGRIDDGVGAHYLRPCMFTSPGFVTCFPKTKKEHLGNFAGPFERKYLEVDITMKGAGPEQEKFKAFMDACDELLLEYIYNNQSAIGKSNQSKEQLSVLLKRSFRPRMNIKTGKTYADAMTCRYRTPPGTEPEDVPVFNEAGLPYGGELEFNDIVSVVLKYEGCYCRANSWFGNSWSLVAAKHMGKFKRPEDAPEMTPDNVKSLFGSAADSDMPQ